jgi:hypothetical protein
MSEKQAALPEAAQRELQLYLPISGNTDKNDVFSPTEHKATTTLQAALS